jgi:basic amino acid/polyamine antiporter, APA family
LSEPAKHKLARSLRERDLLLLFIGSVIGSGIFLTPALILRQVGGSVPASLMVWILGGLLSMLGALTYAELAAANPEAGGLYCYIRDGFGRLPAFLYGWCLFLVIASATIGALAHAFTKYLQEIIPLTTLQSTLVLVLMISVVTAVNIWGTRKSSDLQNVTTLIKVGIIVVLGTVLVVLGSLHGHHRGEITEATGSSLHGVDLFSGIGLAMISVLWAYEGWQFGTYSAGEVKDPQRSFPRAFFLGSLLLACLYLFAVVAYLVALGPSAAAKTDTIAAAAATTVLGPWAGKLVAATILVSTFSSANSVMLTAPRVYFAMANDKLFFKQLAQVHLRFGTPAAAVLALGIWSCVLALAGGLPTAQFLSAGYFMDWAPLRFSPFGRPTRAN